MSLRPDDFLIDDDTPEEITHDYRINGEPVGRGYVPRDYKEYPAEMFDLPTSMPLIPRSEWSARIKEMEETKSSISHIRGDIPSLQQGTYGYCWAHSTVTAIMLSRAVNNLPYIPLSAFAVAATIKRGANEGGWCGLSAKFTRERGVPSQAIWPQGDANYRRYDKPEVWENAALHKVTEEWVDLTRSVYDQNLTFDQLATALLCRMPGPIDLNFWGHSVCAMDLVEVEPGSYGVRFLNSWSDGWGSRGTGVLRGNKAVPDGALTIRSTRPSLV